MSDALNVVSHSYPEISRKAPSRDENQEPWSNLDPARLIDLLEDIDGLKHEVHERMLRVEAVNKAKSLLQEDAIRTEALNRRLAELGRAFGEVRPQIAAPETRFHEAELLRMPARELHVEHPHLQIEVAVHSVEGIPPVHLHAIEAVSQMESFGQAATIQTIVAQAASSRQLFADPEQERLEADLITQDHGHDLEKHPASPEETWRPVTDTYRTAAQRFSETALQKDEAIQGTVEAKIALDAALDKLGQAETTWNQAHEILAEAKQLFALSSEQFSLAQSKAEAAATDLKSAQQDLTTSYQFASVAAQRQNDAAQFFQRSNRWTIHAAATSWLALAWFAWFVFRAQLPIWSPAAATALIVLLAMLVAKWASHRE